MESLFRGGLGYAQPLIVVIVKHIEGIGIVHHHIKECTALIRRRNSLLPDGSAHHLHQLAKLRNLLFTDSLIHRISLDEILLENGIRPLAETHTPHRIDTITNRDNHIKIIIRNRSYYLSIAFRTNLCIFCTSCLFLQFSYLVNVPNMAHNYSSVRLKQFRHLRLRKPHGFPFQLDIKLCLSIFTLINNYFVV